MSRDRICLDVASILWLVDVRNDFEVRERPGVPSFAPRGIVNRCQKVRVKDFLNVSLTE